MSRPTVCAAVALACALPAAMAGQAHEHGIARMDVAVEASRLTIFLETPLDNLVGFEHAPRTDAERRAVDSALGQLRNGTRLFRVDAAAGCSFVLAELFSPVLGTGAAAPRASAAAAQSGHADLRATYRFDCRDGARTARLETTLFQPFTRLQRIDGQAVTASGAQSKFVLRRPSGAVSLAP